MAKTIENKKPSLGKIEIAPEVIEVIASIATTDIKGVSHMQSVFNKNSLEKFGKKNFGKGIKVDIKEDGIYINVYCTFDYGTKISETARKVQSEIKLALNTMTALTPKEVNVHIVNIHFQ